MNKIYKVIWSKAKHCYVVASELAKRNGKSACSGVVKAAKLSALSAVIAASLAAGVSPMTADAAPEPSFAAAEKGEYVALYNSNSAGDGLPADRYTLTDIKFPNGSTYKYYVEDGYNVIGAPSHKYTLLSANDRVFTIVPHLDLSEELNSTSSIIYSTD